MKNLTFLTFSYLSICTLYGQVNTDYNVAIKRADSAYSFHWRSHAIKDSASYAIAKEYYINALKYSPTKQYPKARIYEINKIIYRITYGQKIESLITIADGFILNGSYSKSNFYYEMADSISQAGNLKYQHIIDRIILCNELLNMNSRDSAQIFRCNVFFGDSLYRPYVRNRSHYTDILESITYYEQALSINPKSAYVLMRLRNFTNNEWRELDPYYRDSEGNRRCPSCYGAEKVRQKQIELKVKLK